MNKEVNQIAVDNFLYSIDVSIPMSDHLANAILDAKLYGWNAATRSAIFDGIDKKYDCEQGGSLNKKPVFTLRNMERSDLQKIDTSRFAEMMIKLPNGSEVVIRLNASPSSKNAIEVRASEGSLSIEPRTSNVISVHVEEFR